MAEEQITKDESLRASLPKGFLYACSGASYQIEGGYLDDGKGLGVWDDYFKDKENGNEACDSYHLWRDDIQLLKRYGCNTYRFSVSWPRVKPLGGADDPVNDKGVEYYSQLVDALLAEGITPCVTIFHWDLPLQLEQRYGGFTSPDDIVRDFVAYSKLLFERLGDRVKSWITINEPHIFTLLSAASFKQDGWTEAKYSAYAKSLLLCHAHTVDLYRREFQSRQRGAIGITLNADWVEPIDGSEAASTAAQRIRDHVLGLYADPIYHGIIPESCIERFGPVAPSFSEQEWSLIKGSSDFFGLNTYGTSYASGVQIDKAKATIFEYAFGLHERVYEKDGKRIGVKGHNGHPYNVPWGFRKLLQYLDARYTRAAGVSILITENGFPVENEAELAISEAIHDPDRQAYFAGYLKEMCEAVRDDKIDIGGYMAWSLLDNLEWLKGFEPRFGLTAIDKSNGFKRHPKDSAFMLKRIFDHVLEK